MSSCLISSAVKDKESPSRRVCSLYKFTFFSDKIILFIISFFNSFILIFLDIDIVSISSFPFINLFKTLIWIIFSLSFSSYISFTLVLFIIDINLSSRIIWVLISLSFFILFKLFFKKLNILSKIFFLFDSFSEAILNIFVNKSKDSLYILSSFV